MAESTDPPVPSIPIPPPAALEPTPVVRPATTTPGYPPSPAPASPYVPPAAAGATVYPPSAAGGTAYPAAAYGAVPAQPQGLAIASMICGIAGLVLLGFLSSLAAVITGHIAARKQPWARGMWITGLITGYIGLVVGALIGAFWVIIIAIGIFESTTI
jgi:hypothetical protein